MGEGPFGGRDTTHELVKKRRALLRGARTGEFNLGRARRRSLYGLRGIIVEGELVRLRSYEPSDIAAVMKWINDPEVTQHLEAFVTPVSRLAEERWLETVALGADPNHRIFAIETLGGEYLGGIDLRNIAWLDRKAEQDHFARGEYRDVIIMGLLRSEFPG